MFELVYKQVMPPIQPYMGQNLTVQGLKIEGTQTSKKRAPGRCKTQKLSNPLQLRLLLPNKLRLYDEHNRLEDRTRASKKGPNKSARGM